MFQEDLLKNGRFVNANVIIRSTHRMISDGKGTGKG